MTIFEIIMAGIAIILLVGNTYSIVGVMVCYLFNIERKFFNPDLLLNIYLSFLASSVIFLCVARVTIKHTPCEETTAHKNIIPDRYILIVSKAPPAAYNAHLEIDLISNDTIYANYYWKDSIK